MGSHLELVIRGEGLAKTTVFGRLTWKLYGRSKRREARVPEAETSQEFQNECSFISDKGDLEMDCVLGLY